MEAVDTYLSGLASFVVTMDTEFRRRVCLDCGWSTATFYRRIKPGKLLSRAEMRAIQNITRQLTKELTALANVKP